jgi:hypothetical protein
MKNDLLNDLRIASPCSVPWESMNGTERMRHCGQCALNVYDISQLTGSEAYALITASEGRLCLRLHCRLDGTVITRDCPVGLRALRCRLAWRASAIFTALLSLSASVFTQTRSQDKQSCDNNLVRIEKHQSANEKGTISGVVLDPNGEIVSAAKVTLRETGKKRISISTNERGEFSFGDLKQGEYSLEIDCQGFAKVILSRVSLQKGESQRITSVLEHKNVTVVMGIFAEVPMYENGTMTISGDLIQRLPH